MASQSASERDLTLGIETLYTEFCVRGGFDTLPCWILNKFSTNCSQTSVTESFSQLSDMNPAAVIEIICFEFCALRYFNPIFPVDINENWFIGLQITSIVYVSEWSTEQLSQLHDVNSNLCTVHIKLWFQFYWESRWGCRPYSLGGSRELWW